MTGMHFTPRRIEPATVRESGGIALKRAFGEWFVEARHPDLAALCGLCLRRSTGGVEPALSRGSGGARTSTGIPARLLDFRPRRPALATGRPSTASSPGRAAVRPSSPGRTGSAHPSR